MLIKRDKRVACPSPAVVFLLSESTVGSRLAREVFCGCSSLFVGKVRSAADHVGQLDEASEAIAVPGILQPWPNRVSQSSAAHKQ